MNADQLKALQAPLKQKYKENPAAGVVTLRASGDATGGNGMAACSGDMLLQALVACAGVTLRAVATSIGVDLRRATVSAEGDLDFRGTLGVSKEAPVGFKEIRLRFDLETDATEEQKASLLKLTERYCVVLQTLRHPPSVAASFA